MVDRIRRLGDEDAATAVEYAIMVALIAAIIIAIVIVLGEQTRTSFCRSSVNMEDAGIYGTSSTPCP